MSVPESPLSPPVVASPTATGQHRLALFRALGEDDQGGAPESHELAGPWGTGMEPPGATDGDTGPRTVVRTFGFVDLCGSTSYLETEGARAALDVVTSFRSTVRQVTTRRGVRVAKWMGDGAMLVGVRTGPVVASVVELCARMADAPLQLRGGVSVSVALLCDGDDYLARGANFAARICDAADAGEVLVDLDCLGDVPDWVQVTGRRSVPVRGMGAFSVAQLVVASGVALPPLDTDR